MFELSDMAILLISITKILKWKQQRVKNNMDMSESSYNTESTREKYTGACAGFDWGRINIAHAQSIELKYWMQEVRGTIGYNLRV